MFTFTDIIEKKKHNIELTQEEISWLINSYTKNEITDYQMASFCMATYFTDMTARETAFLTKAYIESGDRYDLSKISGFKADKHSTGGVGDKTSLVYAPLVASYGIKVCKLSGRGLGKTGGTVDKLESFPGWKSEVTNDEFVDVINKANMSLIAQSDNIVPADKKIYALRDVTGTIDSMPLIVASIMSKKLIVENDGLILDVKTGNGAFMTTIEDAKDLANRMIEVGKQYNRKVAVVLTNMNKPLGRAIGNAIEVKEAWETLNGNGPKDFNELISTLVGITLLQAKIFTDLATAKQDVLKRLQSKQAAPYLKEFVTAQGGDWSVLENYDEVFKCKNKIEIKAVNSGFIRYKRAEEFGMILIELGAGRFKKTDTIDRAAGIYLDKQYGDYVNTGDVIMTLYTNREVNLKWKEMVHETYELLDKEPVKEVIWEIISDDVK
ncbi:thymidine phosphorylase [Mycoplasma capricolum subsp. capripneumoniae]|uniref:thymidine phosphorylase n=1 Tax=Mycoplasma capricolum TaxID=2095 RepID=UPI0004D6BB5E|nr:thymidine phosphorylase [Mycoplasma capricolum]KEY84735.1 Thymidine phosphorylase [Mycoplasma capricolum subsp. capripneumoniae 99108]QDL19856.1 thymidine phosphorylase [Mycoplasma capricolum subsp. capripneumoniae]QDL20541.1 thymidine phosphorylase [Mycoplasma capricolum subsp. capripneumoniae]QDL21229.1 thymidine phosphorylase [Mycoplasma capricolum subsp. capripneumoniae]QIF40495.1 thymidine phosphorylase [Mycoplasma capricolum subsp. capripneumoniae]